MQLLARLMDHALAARGERTTIVVATSGDTGGAAVEAFRGRERVDLFVLFPARPHLRGAAPDDDDGRRRQRPRDRDRGHLRRLPGDREGPVQPPRASATACGCRASTRSTGRASSRRWSIISPPRSRSARRIARSPSPCRPAISATSSPAMSPQRMGLPIDRLVIATNVNDILARTLATGSYEVREVVATSSPSMDIQVSSNFERLLFEAYGRDSRQVRALMAQPRAVAAASRCRRARCRRSARCSPPAAPTRRRPRRPSARRCARPAASSIRTPRSASRWPRRKSAIRRCR